MHILLLTEAFPPETKSNSTLFFELAESLVKKGHQVSVVTRMPRQSIADGIEQKAILSEEKMFGIDVFRCIMPPLIKDVPLIRGFEHFLTAFIFFLKAQKVKSFDLILVYSPPLPLGISGYLLGRIRKRPVIVNIQDPYPETVISLGLLKNKLLIKIARLMERFVYKKADLITVHSEGNKDYVIEKGADRKKTEVLYNWVDTELIMPGPKINEFSKKYDLADKFVVSFAGTMGFAQGLDVIIDAANILKENKKILFVVVGDGVKKEGLVSRAKSLGLINILFLPLQPVSVYPKILNASDICLITLSKELATPVIPGKLSSIMASGRPLIASLPEISDARKIISDSNCGICVRPQDPADLAKAILKLYNDKKLCEQMGRNGRMAAERIFSRQAILSKYESIMKSLL
ncbi:MAG: glycosyltransferase family 4 protein [Candidatus Saganbacteria bacterium]|nr:glycosyltransferase family 4 protein [Candidatus Saganbacteria bacterium]